MKAYIRCAVMVLLCAYLLTGCWDYLGMDKINIVAGVAIDEVADGGYELTFELVNIATIKDGSGEESLIVSAQGPSIFEAVRNAKKKLYNSLYFGSMRTVIISENIARSQGVFNIIDGFIRDMEARETIILVISREESAKKLLAAEGLDASNISLEIAKIIEEDQKSDATSRKVQLYEAYNYVMANGLELVLPSFHLVENDGKDVVETNGVAVFQSDKLVAFLSPEETHYFLIATDPDTCGALSFHMPDTEQLVSLEIMRCTNQSKVHYLDGKASIFVTVELDYRMVELTGVVAPVSDTTLREINQQTEAVLADRITRVFNKTQAESGVDIYGYGNYLYENQYHLWKGIADQWNTLYREADFHVQINATNTNVGISL